jgi:uridine kinase
VITKRTIAQRRQKSLPSGLSDSHASVQPPLFVAIVGGSASGKTWLSEKLAARLGGKVTRLSLDSFYRDRSHLPPGIRARLNFDHPRSIDWTEFKHVLRDFCEGCATRVPVYDFKTHSRLGYARMSKARPICLIDGLWLLLRPSIRAFFTLRIFLECPIQSRLRRRVRRDRHMRGRSNKSVHAQFWNTVEPMHKTYVLPQRKWADLVLHGTWGEREVEQVAVAVRSLQSNSGLAWSKGR